MRRALKKFFVLSCCGCACVVMGASLAVAYEYPRYEIQARVDSKQKTVTAQETVQFTNETNEEVTNLYFHIYPNRYYTDKEKKFIHRYGGFFKVNFFPDGLMSTGFSLDGISQHEQPLNFTIEGEDKTLLNVRLPEAVKPGESVRIQINFSLKLPHAFGRLGWHDNILKCSWWYPVLAVHTQDGWSRHLFYPFHRPFYTEAAYYSVQLTVLADEVVIHSGHLKGESVQQGYKVLNIESLLPIREFTFALSPEYQVFKDTFDGIEFLSYYLPGDERFAREALRDAKDLFSYYTKRFGAYPYKQFSIAPVHLGYGGEQMSNLIFIDTRVYKMPGILSRYFDFFIAHEAGHQWFYNILGADSFSEMWLQEGVNSYFTLQYLENKYGKDAQVIVYPRWLKNWTWLAPNVTFERTRDFRYKSAVRQGFDLPLTSRLSSFRQPSNIFTLAYGKGSKVVDMLKKIIGEQAFERMFKRIFKEFQFANMSVEDFVRLAEEESGQDLSAFFKQWVYSAGYLDYAAYVKDNVLILKNEGRVVMPVDVRMDYQNGQSEEFVWDGEKNFSKKIPSGRLVRAVVDPDKKLLDIDRTNNYWPRLMHVKPVGLYWGLYDMPLFMPEDSYNLVIGPELAGSGLGIKASFQKPFDYIIYTASDYEFGEDLHHVRAGYQKKNVFQKPVTFGAEFKNTSDLDDGLDDVASGKVYLRRELWPARYGLLDINDHATLYFIHNQRLNDASDFLSQREDARNIEYTRRKESIVGGALHLNRCGPYPNPTEGYQLDALVESAGHFLEAGQYFHRAAADLSMYVPFPARTILAGRVKYGGGYPEDKDLFQLGGINGLRGYARKSQRGSSVFLGSLEYRFPLKENINAYAADHIFGIHFIGGVVFADMGQAWFSSFKEAELKKDVGVGLRMTVDIGSFLEQVVIRADVARAVHDSEEGTRFWLGVNHAF